MKLDKQKILRAKTDFDNVYNAAYEKGKSESVSVKEEQEKTVSITKNGITEVLPDEDKTLSKVNVDVDVVDYLPYIITSIRFSTDIAEITDDDIYLDLSNVPSIYAAFKSILFNCKKLTVKISNLCTNFHSAFFGAVGDGLEEIEIIGDTSNVTNYYAAFKTRVHLKRIIGELDFSKTTSVDQMFMNCERLVSVRATGTIYVTIVITSRVLDTDSAKSFLLCLADYLNTENEYTYKISFHSDVWSLLDAEGEAAPDGNTWRDYAYNKGWNT